MTDRLGRPLTDVRISVTDRCNLRCPYCMPREVFGPDHAFLDRADLLSFEEIKRVVDAFTQVGVDKVRLTGGEPLLRRDLPDLIAMLNGLDGLDDIALTTNGVLLAHQAEDLRAAGLERVTVSLDALDDETFQRAADAKVPVRSVLDGIAAAQAAGLDPVKINTVVRRDLNEHEVVPLAAWARENDLTIRFIEYMDVGSTNGWRKDDVVGADEILATIDEHWPTEPIAPDREGQPAEEYRYVDGGGTVGVIASVTRPFCRTCSRARVSAVGELFTCLFATSGHDLRPLVRDGASTGELAAAIRAVWSGRTDRYSEERAGVHAVRPRVEMSYIGG
ncbi:MAG: GTP 3',8-cyclase MoaA [Nitriliruptorales bacterium]|nr:GTP 3',8-cyclase MoaA [Nitriliruptorales bacterium]